MMNLKRNIWSGRQSPYGPLGIRGLGTLQLEAELGLLTPLQKHLRLQFTDQLIQKLGLSGELRGHEGCVNCLEWNFDGTLLASGSDDCKVRVWNPYLPAPRQSKHVIHTGHLGNIFGVKFLPGSSDNVLLSCAADSTVRMHDVNYADTVKVFPCHVNRAKRLAVSLDSPSIFWSAGEDGLILQYDLREPSRCDSHHCYNILINLNVYMASAEAKSIACNPVRPHYLAVGASDCFTRLYDRRMLRLQTLRYPMARDESGARRHSWLLNQSTDVDQFKLPIGCVKYFAPGHLPDREARIKNHLRTFAVTDVRFSPDGADILSNIGGEQIYLFNVNSQDESSKSFIIDQDSPLRKKNSAIIPSLAEQLKNKANEYYHENAFIPAVRLYDRALMYCPNSSILYSNRAIALLNRNWDGDSYQALLDAYTAFLLDPTSDKAVFRLIKGLYSLDRIKDAYRWLQFFRNRNGDNSRDVLKSKSFLNLEHDVETAFAKSSRNGVGHKTAKAQAIWAEQEASWKAAGFDYEKRFLGHCNTTTDIKEANFLGQNSQYIMAGSDDGSFFIWDRESTNLMKILKGDSNIVNCLQPHPAACMIATSGIDSEIRLWGPQPDADTDEKEASTEEASGLKRRVTTAEENFVGMEVEDVNQATNANQRRMNADPWSVLIGSFANQVGPDMARNIDCVQQ